MEGERFDFGKIYSVIMAAVVALIAFCPIVGVTHLGWSALVTFLSAVFEFVLWCILAFVVYQRHISAVLVFGVAALFFGYAFTGSWPAFVGSYVLVLAAMLALGMMVGGLAPNEKVAGVLASLLYFPMLLLSGTTLPYEMMPTAVQRGADLLPLTQGVKLLKATSLGLPVDQAVVPVAIMAVWAAVCTVIAVRFFKWE